MLSRIGMVSRIGSRRGVSIGGTGPFRDCFGAVSLRKRIARVWDPEPDTTLGAATASKYYMGIESSCDDTGVAIVAVDDVRDARGKKPNPRILSNIICSQADIHAPFGGVVPKLAQEAHQNAIDNAVDAALRDAGIRAADLEAVGVTIGPGLSLCLRVGVSKAKELCAQHDVPMIDVHHMEAHALVARLAEDVPFPFLCLLVSGGHNLMLVVEGIGRFVQLGTTLDDALGECYDKTARALDLEAVPSGGAALEALAREGDEEAFSFPVPLKKRRTCDFSFAGLKTSVRLAIEREQQKAARVEVRLWYARNSRGRASGARKDRQRVAHHPPKAPSLAALDRPPTKPPNQTRPSPRTTRSKNLTSTAPAPPPGRLPAGHSPRHQGGHCRVVPKDRIDPSGRASPKGVRVGEGEPPRGQAPGAGRRRRLQSVPASAARRGLRR